MCPKQSKSLDYKITTALTIAVICLIILMGVVFLSNHAEVNSGFWANPCQVGLMNWTETWTGKYIVTSNYPQTTNCEMFNCGSDNRSVCANCTGDNVVKDTKTSCDSTLKVWVK